MGLPVRAKNGQHAACSPVVVDLQALHQAVILGDSLTADALARLVLPRLVASLHSAWPGSSSAMIEEAAEDAILWYLANPTRYDPERSGLPTFLHLIARRNMTHARRRERRRLTHEVPIGLSMPNVTPGYPTPTWRACADDLDDPSTSSNDLSTVLALAMTDAEREFVLARAKGENTSTLATIIGAGDSPDEQRRAVHRVMARLRQRARR